MNERPTNYNLLVEQWIPILMTDGKCGRIGIRDALTQAGRIRQIAASNPMDRVAILRFLLALLYWCKGNPADEGRGTSGDAFPADWFLKLNDNEDCFNLLGEGKRFYQDRAARRSRAATDLIQEIPTGNNYWHFRHSTDKADGVCHACCAMGLLRLPLFSVSGLPDLKSGINGTPPVYVVPWGMSLLETLLANWSPSMLLGEPAWTQPDIRPTPGQDVPLLTGLTLLSRRVWLDDPEQSGTCVGCGAVETPVIRTCMFQSAGEQKNAQWSDPHVVYSGEMPRRASKAADLTTAGKFRMDRPWPDLLARMLEAGKFGPGKRSAAFLIVGFATDQAKNIDVWERLIALTSSELSRDTATSMILQWQKQASQLGRRISGSKTEGTAALAAVRPHVEGRVSGKVGDLLAGDANAWDRAAAEYRPMMDMIAQSLSPGFTTAAVQRRKEIANVLPDMRPQPEAAKKTGRKKGGDT